MIKLFAKTKVGFWVDSSIELFTFPAGEPHARDKDDGNSHHVAQLAVVLRPTMTDLWALDAWRQVVSHRGEKAWVAMPYVPFARADRGVPLMSEVFRDWLWELAIDRLCALDVHSPVMEKYLSSAVAGGTSVDPQGGVSFLDLPELVADASKGTTYDGVIAPDKGAGKRAGLVGDRLDVPLYTAGKTRDFNTGKLAGFHMEDELPKTGRFLLVDDICDGGGTFIGLAEAIAKTNPEVKLDLWVSHGVFSKGTSGLFPSFGTVYTTNSFYQTGSWEIPGEARVVSLDLIPSLFKEISK